MPTDTSEPFIKMAERIKHNADAVFGGAAVIVPPGGGDPVRILLLEGEDEGQFWADVLTKAQKAINEKTDQAAVNRTYGIRR